MGSEGRYADVVRVSRFENESQTRGEAKDAGHTYRAAVLYRDDGVFA